MLQVAEQLDLFQPAARVVEQSEIEKKKEVMLMLEKQRQGELEIKRRAARHFCHANRGMAVHNVPHSVCADDINEELGTPVLTRHHKDSYRNNVNGQIFKASGWVMLGRIVSRRQGGHGNDIGLWTLEIYEKVARPMFERAGQERNA